MNVAGLNCFALSHAGRVVLADDSHELIAGTGEIAQDVKPAPKAVDGNAMVGIYLLQEDEQALLGCSQCVVLKPRGGVFVRSGTGAGDGVEIIEQHDGDAIGRAAVILRLVGEIIAGQDLRRLRRGARVIHGIHGEKANLLGAAAILESEIIPGQAGDRMAGLVLRDNADPHQVCRSTKRGLLLLFLSGEKERGGAIRWPCPGGPWQAILAQRRRRRWGLGTAAKSARTLRD